MSTDGSSPAASSLYAQALHSNNFRAHVAHGRIESGVLALLRRKIHELSQPASGADEYDPIKMGHAKSLQIVVEKLLIVPGDVEAWAVLKNSFSAENSGIRPGVLSAILASMLEVGAATAAPAPSPTVDNFLPTFIRRSTVAASTAAAMEGQPGALQRGSTYHASKIGNAPSSLFGQAMVLWRTEQGSEGVIALLKSKFNELVQRHSAEERAQAQELQSILERFQVDPMSGAGWHTLSSSHFTAANSGLSSVLFNMQIENPPQPNVAAVAPAGAGGAGEAPSNWQGSNRDWKPPMPGAMSRGGHAQYASNTTEGH